MQVEQGVAWLTLNRPEALNALTPQVGEEILTVLERVAGDPEVRALVITGAGRGFCTGADLKAGAWMLRDGRADLLSPLREIFHPMIMRLRTLEKPVIASALLVGRIGHGRASEVALLAERIGAEQALAWGLANRVVPDLELRAAAAALAARFAAGPPGSYASIKRSLNAFAYPRLAEQLELEAQLQQERAESADFLEGVQAFLEKRPAQFTGD